MTIFGKTISINLLLVFLLVVLKHAYKVDLIDPMNLYKRKFDAFWAFRRHKANLQVELKDNLVWVFDMIDDLG